MTIDAQTIITASSVVAAIVIFIKYYNKIYDLIKHQKQQDIAISTSNYERSLIVYALSACLDGLSQLGCNHSVTDAKDKLSKYLNQQAHDQLNK